MPKVNIGNKNPSCPERIAAFIKLRMYEQGITCKEMAEVVNMHPNSFSRRRKNNPEKFTLEQLEAMFQVLGIPKNDEIRKI